MFTDWIYSLPYRKSEECCYLNFGFAMQWCQSSNERSRSYCFYSRGPHSRRYVSGDEPTDSLLLLLGSFSQWREKLFTYHLSSEWGLTGLVKDYLCSNMYREKILRAAAVMHHHNPLVMRLNPIQWLTWNPSSFPKSLLIFQSVARTHTEYLQNCLSPFIWFSIVVIRSLCDVFFYRRCCYSIDWWGIDAILVAPRRNRVCSLSVNAKCLNRVVLLSFGSCLVWNQSCFKLLKTSIDQQLSSAFSHYSTRRNGFSIKLSKTW